MDALTLYVDGFWVSPWALCAFVALEELGLPYTVKEVALNRKEHQGPQYRAHTGRIPALVHGDYWLAESSAICEYLADNFPPPRYPRIFPETLQQRGTCREIQAWLRSDLRAIIDERGTHTVWYETTRTPLTSAGRAAAEKLISVASGLIADGKTTLFDTWCIADTDLALMLQRLNLNGDPMPKKLQVYADAQWNRPSFRKWTERNRPVFESY